MAFSRRRTNLSWKGKLGPETLEVKSIFKWLNKQAFLKKITNTKKPKLNEGF